MAEYIEREAAKAAMTAKFNEDVVRFGVAIPECFDDETANAILDDIPAADVREVVYCRDCKYYNDETCDRWSDGTYLKPNDFCSRAARI